MTHLYVMKCTYESKFFVATSVKKLSNPIGHFNKQYEDLCYIQDYPITEEVIHEVINDTTEIDDKVLELMIQYGALNVRGGSYMVLTKDVVDHLLTIPIFNHNKCLLCLSTKHSSTDCTVYNSDDDSDYVPEEDDEEEDSDDSYCSESMSESDNVLR